MTQVGLTIVVCQLSEIWSVLPTFWKWQFEVARPFLLWHDGNVANLDLDQNCSP